MSQIASLIEFWRNEIGPKGWYAGSSDIDDAITARYRSLWDEAADGGLGHWLTDAEGAYAYLLLTDQFPRNMFRNDARSFLLDPNARAAAKLAMDQGWDMQIDEPERQFFYLPLMHSETPVDPDRCMACFKDRMPKMGADNLRHAAAHRWIIKRYGRFPYRNEALGRETTSEEAEFMRRGGYATVLDAA